jgi:hypothetical protein
MVSSAVTRLLESKLNIFSPLTDLKTYCDNNKIKYTLFKDWTVVKAMVEKIISGEIPIESVRKPKA